MTEHDVVLRERAACEACERPATHVVGCNGKTAHVCGECGMRVLACAAAVGNHAGLRRISERVS